MGWDRNKSTQQNRAAQRHREERDSARKRNEDRDRRSEAAAITATCRSRAARSSQRVVCELPSAGRGDWHPITGIRQAAHWAGEPDERQNDGQEQGHEAASAAHNEHARQAEDRAARQGGSQQACGLRAAR